MLADSENILAKKDEWLETGFFAGSAIITFFQMQQKRLDVIFDYDNEIVIEYMSLLKRCLETSDKQILLMASREIERCCFGFDKRQFHEGQGGVHSYLIDEIISLFQQMKKQYPFELVVLHVGIMKAFFLLDISIKSYLLSLKDTYKIIFGENSFLFCHNWCYVLSEIIVDDIENIVVKEYEENKALFLYYLKSDEVLYWLRLKIAVKQVNEQRNLEYLNIAIEDCSGWIEECNQQVSSNIYACIDGIMGMYCRNIGDTDNAIRHFNLAAENSYNLNYKLFMILQKGTILYYRREKENLFQCIMEGLKELQGINEINEYAIEMANLYGCYYLLSGIYTKAYSCFERAEKNSLKLYGSNAELTLKCQVNRIMAQYYDGDFGEAREQMLMILEKMSDSSAKKSDLYAMVQNNVIVMSVGKIDSKLCRRMERVINSIVTSYDLITAVTYKSNLYWFMIISENSQYASCINSLENELNQYFARNLHGEGYSQFLMGKAYRSFLRGETENGYRFLKSWQKCFEPNFMEKGYNSLVTIYFLIDLMVLLNDGNFEGLHKLLSGIGERYLKPLFILLLDKKEDNVEAFNGILYTLISVFLSAAVHCSQIGITPKEIYGVILDYKYLMDLFYCNREMYTQSIVRSTFAMDGVYIGNRTLVLEYFNYAHFDLTDAFWLKNIVHFDFEKKVRQICFGIQGNNNVDILSNENLEYIGEECDITNILLDYEERFCESLRPLLYEKDTIYVCVDTLPLLLPIGGIRINQGLHIGDLFQIIYCDTGRDVAMDITVSDTLNSMFFGISEFISNTNSSNKKKLGKFLNELPFVQLEIEYSASIMGGQVINYEYFERRNYEQILSQSKAEIIHLATHTTKDDKTGEGMLVVGKDWTNSVNILRYSDIEKMDWTNVKLVVLSGCETETFRQAIKKAGARSSITTYTEVYDDVNMIFMVFFYECLIKYKKIGYALFQTQKTLSRITKHELLLKWNFMDFDMEYYLQDFADNDRPFEDEGDWAVYLYQIN